MGPERRVRAGHGHGSTQWSPSGGSWEEGETDRFVMLTLAAQGCLARGRDRHIRHVPRDCQVSCVSRCSWGEQANLLQAVTMECQGAERGRSGKDCLFQAQCVRVWGQALASVLSRPQMRGKETICSSLMAQPAPCGRSLWACRDSRLG